MENIDLAQFKKLLQNKEFKEVEKFAIYRRISAGDLVKNHKGQSLEAQWTKCVNYITNHFPDYDLTQIKDYCDDGISAKRIKSDREALMQLMMDVKNLKITKIFIIRQDRFTRQIRDLDLYNILEALDVELITVDTGQNLTSKNPFAKFLRNLQILLAELEVELTSERQRETKQAMFEQGKFRGGFLPFGFKWDYDESIKNKKLIQEVREIAVVQEEKLVYKKILHKFFEENKGTTVIAKELNKEGVSFRTGEKKRISTGEYAWTNTNVLELLRNPLWMGKQAKNKYLTITNLDGSKSRKRLSPREWELEVISNIQEKVIDDETYWKIIDKLESRTNKAGGMSPRTTQTSWLLSSILECECGSSMITKHPRENYKYYKCSNSNCKMPNIKKYEIEEEALKIFAKEIGNHINDYDLMDEVILKLKEDVENNQSNIETTMSQISKVEEDINDLKHEYINKKENPQRRMVIEDMIAELMEKKNNLEESLKYQQDLLEENKDKAINFKESLQAISLLENVFKVDYYDDKDLINIQRSLLLSFVNKFYIKDDELKIKFREENEGIPKYLLGRFDKNIHSAIGEVFDSVNEVSVANEQINNSLDSLMELIRELQPRILQTDVLIMNVLSNLTNMNNRIEK